MNDSSNLVNEFLVESYENLDQLDRELIELEKDPRNQQRLASIFRTIHTIKGTCGFFGFHKLESVTHVGENLLSRLRDGELLLDPEITSGLLAMVDAVREMLSSIEKSSQEGDRDYSPLVGTLTRLQEGAMSATAPPPQISPPPASAVFAAGAALAAVQPGLVQRPAETCEFEPIAGRLGGVLHAQGLVKLEDLIKALQRQVGGDRRRLGEILIDLGIVKAEDVQEALRHVGEGSAPGILENNIRVDVGLLDKLMNLVGELVLARNQILQFTATQKDTAFLSTTQRLNLITTELQEGVMKTRMQPIGNIWNRFPRVVRDLATQCGKQVRIEMEGKDTELDKTIIEAIKDPLTHVVRNAVDHGIEPPDLRQRDGKPAQGCLFLRAYHEGGQVNIEISDDGAGIDPERVKAKAVERGLINRDQSAHMSDREVVQLIFLPGFSTAETVSNLSGRGVGMDVVKTNIEKIGGTVDLQSQPGKGTTLKIKIPLTLAIIPALIVTSGGDRYAIPQVSLLELVRLEGEQARRGIENIHGAPVYRLRGRLLPLVHLNQELKTGGRTPATGQDSVNIVVLQADGRQFGLVVEGINDTEEIVVKPLGKQLKGIPVFSGATIMGDGRVALILDVLGIAQRSGVISEVHDRALAELAAKAQEKRDSRQTLLLLGLGHDGRMAIPLSMVARLEEIPIAAVERADGQEVVQYRGQILPLLRLSSVLGHGPMLDAQDPMQVVVYSEQGQSVGLVVDRILDIVETTLEARRAARRDGILGSAVIQQRVTDLLDMHGIIRSADPAFGEQLTGV